MAGLWPAGWAARCADPGHAPLILTAALPAALQQAADAVRNRLQPAAARHAPAHLTLFRHLPGGGAAELLRDVRTLAADAPAPLVHLGPLQRWEGLRGDMLWVAPAASPALDRLREGLAQRWHGLLVPGDAAPPRFHISLGKGAVPPPSLPEGPWRLSVLLLWQYGETCWTPLVACRFRR